MRQVWFCHRRVSGQAVRVSKSNWGGVGGMGDSFSPAAGALRPHGRRCRMSHDAVLQPSRCSSFVPPLQVDGCSGRRLRAQHQRAITVPRSCGADVGRRWRRRAARSGIRHPGCASRRWRTAVLLVAGCRTLPAASEFAGHIEAHIYYTAKSRASRDRIAPAATGRQGWPAGRRRSASARGARCLSAW